MSDVLVFVVGVPLAFAAIVGLIVVSDKFSSGGF